MATVDPPLDEMQWRSPNLIQQLQGLNSNNVLHYFRFSPFFENASNNSTLFMQAQVNPALGYLFFNRNAFEARLRGMVGLEFVVAEEDPVNAFWLIKKQRRMGPSTVDVLAAYFVIGENVYMAPTVHSIVESRVLSIASSLSQAQKLAESLVHFSPASGYSYYPPQTTSLSSSASQHSLLNINSNNMNNNTSQSMTTSVSQQSPMPSSTAGTVPPSSINKQIFQEQQGMMQSLYSSLKFASNDSGYLEDTPILDPQQRTMVDAGKDGAGGSGMNSTSSTQQSSSSQNSKMDLKGGGMDATNAAAKKQGVATANAVTPIGPGTGMKKRRKSKGGGLLSAS